MNECPCKGCPDRYIGCHSDCNGYKEWHNLEEVRKEKIRAAKEQENAILATFTDRKYRRKK